MRDCIVHVLTKGEDGYPAFRKEDERYCLNCQHNRSLFLSIATFHQCFLIIGECIRFFVIQQIFY